jgi:hypothetical protein
MMMKTILHELSTIWFQCGLDVRFMTRLDLGGPRSSDGDPVRVSVKSAAAAVVWFQVQGNLVASAQCATNDMAQTNIIQMMGVCSIIVDGLVGTAINVVVVIVAVGIIIVM